MVSKDHRLSVRRQCALLTLALTLARSNLYYEPKGESTENCGLWGLLRLSAE